MAAGCISAWTRTVRNAGSSLGNATKDDGKWGSVLSPMFRLRPPVSGQPPLVCSLPQALTQSRNGVLPARLYQTQPRPLPRKVQRATRMGHPTLGHSPTNISTLMLMAGKAPSTINNGAPRSGHMQRHCWTCRSMRSPQKTLLPCYVRSGGRSRKPQPAFAEGSKSSSMPRKRRSISPVHGKTRPAGKAILFTCYHGSAGRRRSSIMPPYPTRRCLTSSPSYGGARHLLDEPSH